MAIALGTYLGGWRIIRTLGKGLVEIESPQGVAAEASSAAVILASSHFGFALSTTHVATGSILGTGLGKRGAEVRWRIAGRMAAGWLLTLPAAAVVGALVWLVGHAFGTSGAGSAIGSLVEFAILVAPRRLHLPALPPAAGRRAQRQRRLGRRHRRRPAAIRHGRCRMSAVGYDLRFAVETIWKVGLASLVLGAGLPMLFAAGIRSLAWGAGGEAEVSNARPNPIGKVLAAVIFLIVAYASSPGSSTSSRPARAATTTSPSSTCSRDLKKAS